MTYGPIDLIALEFPGNRFKGEILPDLLELVDKEIIRIIDLVVIMKDQGEVIVRELRELDAAHMAMSLSVIIWLTSACNGSNIAMCAGSSSRSSRTITSP